MQLTPRKRPLIAMDCFSTHFFVPYAKCITLTIIKNYSFVCEGVLLLMAIFAFNQSFMALIITLITKSCFNNQVYINVVMGFQEYTSDSQGATKQVQKTKRRNHD